MALDVRDGNQRFWLGICENHDLFTVFTLWQFWQFWQFWQSDLVCASTRNTAILNPATLHWLLGGRLQQ
jgi:hypothetical protein